MAAKCGSTPWNVCIIHIFILPTGSRSKWQKKKKINIVKRASKLQSIFQNVNIRHHKPFWQRKARITFAADTNPTQFVYLRRLERWRLWCVSHFNRTSCSRQCRNSQHVELLWPRSSRACSVSSEGAFTMSRVDDVSCSSLTSHSKISLHVQLLFHIIVVELCGIMFLMHGATARGDDYMVYSVFNLEEIV